MKRITASLGLPLFAMALCGVLALAAAPGSAAQPMRPVAALPAALRPALYKTLADDAAADYRIGPNGCASLPGEALRACFGSNGVRVRAADSTVVTLQLVAYGRGADLQAVGTAEPEIDGNHVNYVHGNLTEWWRVLPVGFEQGFTIRNRPAGDGELVLALDTRSRRPGERRDPVTKSIPTDGRDSSSDSIPAYAGMTGKKSGGTLRWGRLRYGGLVVTDAAGRVVPATLQTKDRRIRIAVNDAHARYPLTVDPMLWLQQKVTASDGGEAQSGDFGYAVAIADGTALVGAPGASVALAYGAGAVYVFTETNGSWSESQKLVADDSAGDSYFGYSVALEGSTALIGSERADIGSSINQGAAYVFTRLNGSWAQAQKLVANDGQAYDGLGYSVALSGDTALIGAAFATVDNNTFQGSAYVFTQSGDTWTQAQKLLADDGAADDYFGVSVALFDTTALVGAQGAAIDGNAQQGATYVFTGSGSTWNLTQKLTADDGAADDQFGRAVALAGSTALIGAYNATIDGNPGQGAVYAFTNSGGSWFQKQKLTASDGAGITYGFFGTAIGLSGTTAIIGAPTSAILGDAHGAAYLFDDVGGSWTQKRKLKASDGTQTDWFGYAVALDGGNSLVGAAHSDVDGNHYQGAGYFYGNGNLDLNVSAPQTVGQGETYLSQTIATNVASAASPAVSATMAVPAAASFVSASASQGSCSEETAIVTCDFGAIAGDGATATANVTLKAIGAAGTAIENTASIANATPRLAAAASTQITEGGGCPGGYAEYPGSLNPGAVSHSPPYRAPAGEENAILDAPGGFRLYAVFQNAQGRKVFRIPGNEIHRRGPAGSYAWAVKAGESGGAYTLCVRHP